MTTADTEQSQGNGPAIQEPVAPVLAATVADESDTDDNTQAAVDERAMLMQRARMMGLNISNNIGVETLRQRIKDHLDGKQEKPVQPPPPMHDPELPPVVKAGKVKSLRQRLYEENMRLIRIRITNLDPKKKDLPGEIITIANEYLGTVKKYVPYGEVTDQGYHVPYCIYKLLRKRKFLNIRTRKDKSGLIHVEQSWVLEFAIEVLEPLTKEEIKQLATAQIAAGSV